MAAKWLKIEDFKIGQLAIGQSTEGSDDLETYIEDAEVRYLQELFGADLYVKFLADLDNNSPFLPTTDKFKDVFDPFFEDNSDFIPGGTRRSEGIIEMLKYFVYFEYVRDQKFDNTDDGTTVAAQENSREPSFPEQGINKRYNRGQQSYIAIQWKMIDESATYDDFNGEGKKPISII